MIPQKSQIMDHSNMRPCEDCGNTTQLCTVSACPEPHTSGNKCCTKDVCADYCRYTCLCGMENYISREDLDHLDNYMEGFICFSCGNKNDAHCLFWGDLRENCRRYCNADRCMNTYSFIVYGRAPPSPPSHFGTGAQAASSG